MEVFQRYKYNKSAKYGFKVKTRNDGEIKFPPPRRQDWMIRAIHRCQVAEYLESIEVSQHILPYDEPDLYNDYISKEPDYIDRFSINCPCHCVLGHVLSDSIPLDNLGPWKEVVQPTTQIETKEHNKQKENTPEEQEIQECD